MLKTSKFGDFKIRFICEVMTYPDLIQSKIKFQQSKFHNKHMFNQVHKLPKEIYLSLQKVHQQDYARLNKKYNFISVLRFAMALTTLICLIYYVKQDNQIMLISACTALLAFGILIRNHRSISNKRSLKKALIEVNKNEISILNHEKNPYDNGIEFNDHTHSYAHDLDIFGLNSLFHSINRTSTYIGKTTLANSLLQVKSPNQIIAYQDGIKELTQQVDWRQEIMALAKIAGDSGNSYLKLLEWSKSDNDKLPKISKLLSFIIPSMLIICLGGYMILGIQELAYGAALIFVTNLLILVAHLKSISNTNFKLDRIHKIIKQYSLILKKIEGTHFESDKLKELKSNLDYQSGSASQKISRLSSLFASMDNINNALGAMVFNGLFLYHLHTLRLLQSWKKAYGQHVPQWLNVIGEFETLNSLAGLAYNNQSFVFPSINNDCQLEFEELGHPLIKHENRIVNSVQFNSHKFFILTGSNMSGKSTFLRTLGINMVLAGIGAPVCATKANVHPFPILVSMRLSDSLSDSESYFFAEVKRLKEIMTKLDKQVCFVLLDEILRGTNSDDKRTGTIEVIKKIISKGAIGAIATHDLEVCLTTEQFPNILVNKCFEVEIIENNLSFDYKLKQGICKNKSATFLMKQEEII